MGTPKAPWQNQVAIELQQTSISTAGTFATGTFGIEAISKHLLPVLNRDYSLNPGLQFIEDRRAYGVADQNIAEQRPSILSPTTSIEFAAHSYNLKKALWSLFQTGASEAAGTPFLATYVIPTSPVCEVWATIADPITGTLGSGNNEAIHGGVINELGLSAEQGGQLVAASSWIGANYVKDFNSGTAVTLVDHAKNALLWQDATVELDGNAINIMGFNLTLNNGAEVVHYDSQTALKVILGDWTVSGELVIPRDSGSGTEDDEAQITDLLDGDSKQLEIYWGSSPASAEASFCINCQILYKEKEKSNEIEVGNRLPFVQVNETNALTITSADADDLTIP